MAVAGMVQKKCVIEIEYAEFHSANLVLRTRASKHRKVGEARKPPQHVQPLMILGIKPDRDT